MKTKLLTILALAMLVFALPALAQNHSVTLGFAWSQGTGGMATGFNIYRGTTSGAEGPAAPATKIGNVPYVTPPPATWSYKDTASLVEGTKYFYVITAAGNGGTESAPSVEVGGTIPFSVPNVPTAPTIVVQ